MFLFIFYVFRCVCFYENQSAREVAESSSDPTEQLSARTYQLAAYLKLRDFSKADKILKVISKDGPIFSRLNTTPHNLPLLQANLIFHQGRQEEVTPTLSLTHTYLLSHIYHISQLAGPTALICIYRYMSLLSRCELTSSASICIYDV